MLPSLASGGACVPLGAWAEIQPSASSPKSISPPTPSSLVPASPLLQKGRIFPKIRIGSQDSLASLLPGPIQCLPKQPLPIARAGRPRCRGRPPRRQTCVSSTTMMSTILILRRPSRPEALHALSLSARSTVRASASGDSQTWSPSSPAMSSTQALRARSPRVRCGKDGRKLDANMLSRQSHGRRPQPDQDRLLMRWCK